MNLDLTTVMKDEYGKDMVSTISTAPCPRCNAMVIFPRIPAGESIALTLRQVCLTALYGKARAGEVLGGETKYARHKLKMKIGDSESVGLSHEECVMLKGAIDASYGTCVMGQAWDLIEAVDKEEKPEA